MPGVAELVPSCDPHGILVTGAVLVVGAAEDSVEEVLVFTYMYRSAEHGDLQVSPFKAVDLPFDTCFPWV